MADFKRICGNCRFFKGVKGQMDLGPVTQGQCWNGPPVPLAIPTGVPGQVQVNSVYPIVAVDQPECGQFKFRESELKEYNLGDD